MNQQSSAAHIASLRIAPEPFARAVHAVLRRFEADRLMERLWRRDPTLWPNEAPAQIEQRLGWLSIVPAMQAQRRRITETVARLRADGFTHALLLGMGGSSLFPEVCRFVCGVAPDGIDLRVLDSTDPMAISRVTRELPLDRTLVILASKSGSTIEVTSLGRYFDEQLRATLGPGSASHCMAITDAGTPLEHMARQRKFRAVFAHGPGEGLEVGGRFSALTYFGLVPLALLGFDPNELLERAATMQEVSQAARSLAMNPPAQLAAALVAGYAQGRDKVTLLSSPTVAPFGAWVEQLVAESTGKAGKGLVPIDAEPLQAASRYGEDRLFIRLRIAGEPDSAMDRLALELTQIGHPVVEITWHDRLDLGGEVMRWIIATSLAASCLGVNAFDEPNVQESKDRTKALLSQVTAGKGWPWSPTDNPSTLSTTFLVGRTPRPPVADNTTEGAEAEGRGSMAGSTITPQPIAAAAELLRNARPGDYVAICNFLPRTEAIDRAVAALRGRIAKQTGLATMLGHGPRYLHSTGQLHKGGSDRGVFLVLTAADPEDLPIPDAGYTFGTLKRAQALGDVQALRDRHRRLAWLDLGTDPITPLATVFA